MTHNVGEKPILIFQIVYFHISYNISCSGPISNFFYSNSIYFKFPKQSWKPHLSITLCWGAIACVRHLHTRGLHESTAKMCITVIWRPPSKLLLFLNQLEHRPEPPLKLKYISSAYIWYYGWLYVYKGHAFTWNEEVLNWSNFLWWTIFTGYEWCVEGWTG